MDKFYVIRNGSVIVDMYITEDAAINRVNAECDVDNANKFEVAQVVATSRAVRTWNRP